MIPLVILAIENDDDRAFMEELYSSYQRLMFSETFNLVQDEWEAEDIMQTSLVKLIDKIPLLRSLSRNQLVNYIISTCKNTAYNYIRDNRAPRESQFQEYEDYSSEESDGHSVELRLIKQEELDCLARIWSKLDLRTALLLEGYYILEKPMSELGAELGIKSDSVRMTLTRARAKAFKLLKEELE